MGGEAGGIYRGMGGGIYKGDGRRDLGRCGCRDVMLGAEVNSLTRLWQEVNGCVGVESHAERFIDVCDLVSAGLLW